ncbi:MAG: hypothetical protein ACI8RZ_004929 [Myxococcota bacterium]|jgi:hypothetical protein
MSLAILISMLAPLAHAQSTEPVAKAAKTEGVQDARSAVVATMVLKVTRREEAADAMVALATETGGYFAERSDQRLRLKIPADKAQAYLAAAEAQGVVVDRSFSSTGLSEQIADNTARLAAREDVLGRYFSVLETASTSSVVTVEREIVRLVAEIEQYKGRLRALEHRATYADITLDFQFRDRAAPSRGGSSSFRWLNTLNLADIVEDFHTGSRSTAARRTSSSATPDGFAPYKIRREHRAVSPDDVMFRVRAERHKPKADLDFWEEAVLKRMTEAGYRSVKKQRVTIDGQPGVLLEYTAPYGTDDYTYLLGFTIQGGKVIVFESAGEISRFEARRGEILAAFTAEATAAR